MCATLFYVKIKGYASKFVSGGQHLHLTIGIFYLTEVYLFVFIQNVYLLLSSGFVHLLLFISTYFSTHIFATPKLACI